MAKFQKTIKFIKDAFQNVHVRHVLQTIISVSLSYALTVNGVDCNDANAAGMNAAKIMIK